MNPHNIREIFGWMIPHSFEDLQIEKQSIVKGQDNHSHNILVLVVYVFK